jgi:hypothetical protein
MPQQDARVSRLFHNVTLPGTAGKEAGAKTPRVRFKEARSQNERRGAFSKRSAIYARF